MVGWFLVIKNKRGGKMSWKMIKEGKYPDIVVWCGKCRKCGAEFECLRSDITNYRSPTSIDEAYSWEDCTFCKSNVMVCMHEK